MNFLLPLLCFLLTSPLAAAPRVHFSGTAIQGGFLIGTMPAAEKVFLDGLAVPLTKDGKFILGFGRNYKNKARLKLKTKNGVEEILLEVKQRKYDVQYIDGIAENKVTPPPSAWAQIKNEAKMKRAARKITPLLGWAQTFVWPAAGQISGIYGAQRVLNGKPRRPHFGIDIAAPKNSPVIAPAGGKIVLAAENFYFEGGLIFLDHGFGLSSAFLHLGKILVRAGQEVKQGEVIALIGKSGRSTGHHLDWRIKWQNQNLDPTLIVKRAPADARDCALGAYVVQGQATCYASKANSPAAP